MIRRSLETGAVELVIVAGNAANGLAGGTDISADGRYVLFQSYANNLASGDMNGQQDIFLKDMISGAISLVSTDAAGAIGNGAAGSARLSGNGQYVVFESYASNLVQGDTNLTRDIFRKDLTTGAIERVNTDATGAQANSEAFGASISADGRYVAFTSSAGNLVAGDTNNNLDLFRKDMSTGEIVRLSNSDGDVIGGAAGTYGDISADGSVIAGYYGLHRPDIHAANQEEWHGRAVAVTFDPGAATDVTVDWGDGTSETVTAAAAAAGLSRVYAANGTYDVTLTDASASPTEPTSTTKLHVLGRTHDTATGSAGADLMLGFVGDDTLDGGIGADVMEGGNGWDTYYVDNVGDIVRDSGAEGYGNTVRASIDYVLTENLAHLFLDGTADLSGTGNAGANWIEGNSGNNVLDGGEGTDYLFGNDGNDIIYSGAGNDNTYGNAGNDNLNGGEDRLSAVSSG